MSGLMDFYFNAKGRISRKEYWLKGVFLLLGLYLVAYLVILALAVAVGAVAGEAGAAIVGGLLAIPLVIAVVWAGVCVASKRFHDRNMSGWWYLYFMLMALAAYAVMVVPMLTLGEDNPIAGIFALVGGLAYLAIGITSLVILGFLPGTKGPNKYGADPLDPTGGTAATFA